MAEFRHYFMDEPAERAAKRDMNAVSASGGAKRHWEIRAVTAWQRTLLSAKHPRAA
ncbi:MAG: hypothetical protein ACRBCL_05630 [Maritimibacter sp.]